MNVVWKIKTSITVDLAEHVNFQHHGRGEPDTTVTAAYMLAGRIGVMNFLPVSLKIECVGELLTTVGAGVALVSFVEGKMSGQTCLPFKLAATDITVVRGSSVWD